MELKDYEWEKMDYATITQGELDRIHEILDKFFLKKTKAELLDEAVKKGMFIIPVTTIGDLAESQQLSARKFWKTVKYAALDDTLTYPGWPVKWTEMPDYELRCPPPLIGEHNREIYEEELGFSQEQMELLVGQGVI